MHLNKPLSVALFFIIIAIAVALFATYVHVPRQTVSPSAYIPARVGATHSYADGRHTFHGSVTLPTSCEVMSVAAGISSDTPDHVTLNFRTQRGDSACAQVLSDVPYTISFDAPVPLTAQATFNGVNIPFDVQEVAVPAMP